MSNIYKELYYLLFNYISYANEALERGEYDEAKRILRQAQISSEEQYISESSLMGKIRNLFALK